MARPITILASGTRGDVQPLVALGAGLQRAGYPVKLAAHPPYQALVEGAGLPFAALDGDLNNLLTGSAALSYNGGLLRSARATRRFLQAARPLFSRALRSAWEHSQGAGALIVSLPTTWGAQIASALGLPCVYALVQPLGATAAFPTPLQPFAGSLGPGYNRASHKALEHSLWLPWRAELNAWRRVTLGLPPLPLAGPRPLSTEGALFLYGISPHVLPTPPDWPASRRLTGYWFWDGPDGWQPPAELQTFLADGDAPLYLTFGSSGAGRRPETPSLLLEALARTGRRAIVAAGEQDWPAALPENVLLAGPVPHGWLFPQLAAVVHHGGAGTTAAALRAGVPSVCVPIAVDNFFWSHRLHQLGAAARPVPFRRLSSARLADAIHEALGDASVRQRAADLGEQLRAEDGVGRAVELLEGFLRVKSYFH